MGKIRILMMALAAMISMTAVAEDEKSIAEREYWFDNDVSTLQTLDAATTAVDISTLPDGLHAFSLRVKDSEGLWSSAMTKYFVKRPTPTSTAVTACEYWFDNDVANRKPLSESVAVVDMTGLTQGLHAFTMRVKDDAGVWSSTMTKYFVKKPTPTSTAVAACEYWFDNDVENRKPLSESVAVVDLTGLTQGLHAFTMRVKNDAGVWSSAMTKYFIVPLGADIEGGVTISRYIYWIDDEINDDKYVSGSLSSSSDIVAVDLSSVEGGSHTLSWMVGDSKGTWSQVYNEEFEYDPSAVVTSIEGAETDAADDKVYDLQGRRVKTVKKGLYIINGKVVVK